MRKYLTVDGMLSGTGIRDTVEGGYIRPESLGLPPEIIIRINEWLKKYEEQHYMGFINGEANQKLDGEGIAIARMIQEQIPDCKVEYFSDAYMRTERI
jgi:hypothetical protein